MPTKPPTLKTFRATADLVIDGDLMQASVARPLDPADPNVAAFVKTGKLVEVKPE